MILFIDNYDFFIWNLYQYFCELGVEVLVRCNDVLMLEEIVVLVLEKIVILSGFCMLDEVGIFFVVICYYVGKMLLLGVCFGYQVIVQVFGVIIVWVVQVMYGKILFIEYNGEGVFQGLNNFLMVICYYLLVIDLLMFLFEFNVIVCSVSGEIMGICYCEWDFEGVQFYLESIFSEQGY